MIVCKTVVLSLAFSVNISKLPYKASLYEKANNRYYEINIDSLKPERLVNYNYVVVEEIGQTGVLTLPLECELREKI